MINDFKYFFYMASKSSAIEHEQRAYIKFRSLMKDSNKNFKMILLKFVGIKPLPIPPSDGLNCLER